MLMVVTCLLLYNKRQEEKEQARQIEALYNKLVAEELQQEEHQVDVVQEPYVYKPREDSYYDNLDLLARMIHCENSNEVDGEEACWETGSVIINRINDPDYPNTLEGVLYQQGQYDCIKMLYKEEPTDIEYEVSAELLNSGGVIPPEVTNAAEFVQGKVYDRQGNTIYCYKK